MRCCVTGCKNDSKYRSKSQGITFHVFPVEPSLRSAWLRALGMETWEPGMERSAVCSEHFLSDDLYEPKKGLQRTVKAGAVPVIVQDSKDCEYGDPNSQVCRICLVVESKLFPMRKYKLEQAYENLTGVSACSEKSKLPQKLCAECAQRLVNCARFRSKSLRANSLLTEVIRNQGEITPKHLKTINRKKNQLQSSLESKIYEPDHYDLSHYDDTEIKESSQMTETNKIKNENVIIEIFRNEFDDEILELPIEAREEETIDLKATPENKNENDFFTIKNGNDINSEIDENHDNIDDEDCIASKSSTDDESPRGVLQNLKAIPKIKNENYLITIENDNDKVNSDIDENHSNIDGEDYIANASSTDDELPRVLRNLKVIPKTDNGNEFFTINNGNDKVNSEIDENHDNLYEEDSTDDELPRGVLRNMKAVPKVKNGNDIISIANNNDKVNSEIEVNNDSIDDEDYIANESSTDDELPKGVLRNRSQKRKSKKRENSKTKEPKIDSRKRPFFNRDTLFTVSSLTYEEQVAEIAKRKEGSMYKNAVFKCNDCFRGFVYEDAFNSHMSRHTNESGEYRCEVCKTHFKLPILVTKHIAACHAERFSCKQCPFTTTRRPAAKQHEMLHNGTKYSCPHCPDEFVKISTYMLHIRVQHPSDFVCQLCGYSFVNEKGISSHKRIKHRQDVDKEIPEDGPNCEKCNIRFIDSEALNRHISVSARHSDLERNKRAPNISKPRKVSRKLDPRPRPKDETRKVYPSQMRAEGPIPCEQCGVQLDNARAYHCHFRRVHPDQNRTKYPSMKTPYMCEICGRMFACFAVLKDHRRVHTGERPFSCEDCGKSFQMKPHLDDHRKVHSAEKKTYQCQVCLKHFSTYSNRYRHMLIHSGLRRFKCEVCGKSFMYLYEKRDHIAYVHFKKPWPKRIRGKRRVDPKKNKTPENMPKNR